MNQSTASIPPAPQSIRFVLARTSHPGNIGAAARAIRTMGFWRLVLVAPQRYPDPQVKAMAAGADDVLANLVVAGSVTAAVADCTRVYGLSARRRGVNLPELDPRAAMAEIAPLLDTGREVALLFGNERSGLDNTELSLCHAMVRIPSVEDFSSLNLAQAVQVMAWELRMATLGAPPAAPPDHDAPPATADQMERFFEHLFATLHAIDFHKGRSAKTIEQRLRRLFHRAQPDARELRILHGVLADAERMAELAKKRTPGSQA
ncbi:MAG: tRNA (cytidine(32)/uridine(32)-2'-O)-methyltransferase [Rhodanobacteraceae bacterium]|jgi:tRNA (cytidine32/uridine32-2'-O)-methyltransferase|nr:MAG: tRNA (cytidine(32)/uridine(32)-2'-O)-methyltransferase [Rhodanobacteraceae bacterium]